MFTIYKEPIPDSTARIELPKGARIIAAQKQDGVPTIWFECDPKAEKEKRTFRIFGTGWPVQADWPLVHLGTYQDGLLVWHIYEEKLP